MVRGQVSGDGGNGQVQVLRYSLDSQDPTVVAGGTGPPELDDGGYHLEPRDPSETAR